MVIYEENHSFDNLFGMWPGVNGLANADYHQVLDLTALQVIAGNGRAGIITDTTGSSVSLAASIAMISY